ncbi:hypothetical protein [Actinokineospora sp. NBRC 105648]|uniref:hypothetical protein n=1 Tax=Actinokineospora sp. NBRC 105648 TaxID=3032206 RepID=UPI0024A1D667|nr:hypothetical protein [Actinokineospora sp. NBRC 105648]GLZ40132.1 hypothetical protein Acsp05_37560 [Actinokineospora sp. NBRC 105648]
MHRRKPTRLLDLWFAVTTFSLGLLFTYEVVPKSAILYVSGAYLVVMLLTYHVIARRGRRADEERAAARAVDESEQPAREQGR